MPVNPSPATPYGRTPPAQAPVGWAVRFFDDFTAFTPSAIAPTAATEGTANWLTTIFPSTYNLNPQLEQQYYCSPGSNGLNPFSQAGSILTITARAATLAERTKLVESPHYAAYGSPPYLSGALNSGLFLNDLTSGYFELHAQLPPGSALWSAFWVTGSNTWPPEFDIMEQQGSLQDAYFGTVHYGADNNVAHGRNPISVPTNLTTEFHTYGGLMTPNYNAWYFDGILTGHTATGIGTGTHMFNLHTPMQLVINLAVGTGMGDPPAPASVLPAQLHIDWVRVSALGPP